MPTNPKPTSSKKSATARANGAKSRGPATAAGRARSSQNALRHGLAVRDAALPTVSVVLADESPADFQRLLNAYLDEFAPTSPLEVELVETMASARGRLRRLANIETTLLGNEVDTSVEPHSTAKFFAAMSIASPTSTTASPTPSSASPATARASTSSFATKKPSAVPMPAPSNSSNSSARCAFAHNQTNPSQPRCLSKPPPPFAPSRPTKVDPNALPAPPPILQTPPQSPKIHVEPQQFPLPALQMPIRSPRAYNVRDNGGFPTSINGR